MKLSCQPTSSLTDRIAPLWFTCFFSNTDLPAGNSRQTNNSHSVKERRDITVWTTVCFMNTIYTLSTPTLYARYMPCDYRLVSQDPKYIFLLWKCKEGTRVHIMCTQERSSQAYERWKDVYITLLMMNTWVYGRFSHKRTPYMVSTRNIIVTLSTRALRSIKYVSSFPPDFHGCILNKHNY